MASTSTTSKNVAILTPLCILSPGNTQEVAADAAMYAAESIVVKSRYMAVLWELRKMITSKAATNTPPIAAQSDHNKGERCFNGSPLGRY